MKTVINDFLDFVYQSRSEKTYVTYKAALQKFCDVVGDEAQLTKDTYIKFLLATNNKSPATQTLWRSAIHRLYHYAADTIGGVDTSFFDLTDDRYALKPKKRPIFLDEAGIEKTIAYVNTIRNNPEDLRDRTFILLLADSGLRVSEACNLRLGDVDLLEERAMITGKGDQPAMVKISHRTADAARDYLRVRPASKSMPLFIRHDKRIGNAIKAVTPGYIWHYIKRRIAEAGADPKGIRIHDFRHYFVTTAYRAKGIKTAQVWARHERISTTDRYTHLVDDNGEAYDDVFNKR